MDRIIKIKEELEAMDIIDSSNIDTLSSLCEEIARLNKNTPQTSILIEPLVKILERNPDYDFGLPGCMVHSLETYYRAGLEEELVKSINRKPTFYTVWMLNRILNGTTDLQEQKLYFNTLKDILQIPIPDYLRKQVQHFIDLHS